MFVVESSLYEEQTVPTGYSSARVNVLFYDVRMKHLYIFYHLILHELYNEWVKTNCWICEILLTRLVNVRNEGKLLL